MQHRGNISAQLANEWLSNGEALLIDVREADEFKSEHIACATSVPLSRFKETLPLMHIPNNRKIIFQCMQGKRGEQACSLLPLDGKENEIYNIDGGIESWKTAGLPTIIDKAAKISIFRQVQITVGALVALSVLGGFAVYPSLFAFAAVLGAALAFAGITGWCGLALLLAKAPWNKA